MDVDIESNITSSSEPSGKNSGGSTQGTSSDTDDLLVAATHDLERYAADNQFTIHNVAGDGNCLYNSVLYKLQANGIVTTTAQNLREMVATHLSQHAETYMPFVCSAVQPITMTL